MSGIGRSFCPVSGIINAAIAWALAAETAGMLLAKGETPTTFWGNYLVGGKEKLAEARKRFLSLGY